jgi:MFS family permease
VAAYQQSPLQQSDHPPTGPGDALAGDSVKMAPIPAQPYPKAIYAWFVVICLQLAYAVALIDRQILALLIKPIRADLGLTDTQFSLLVGFAFVLFYSTMGLFCGRLADTRNRRNMIVIGMVLWSFATAACGLASNFSELFTARMMVGVGEAVLSPCAYSMIADYFPKEKRARAAATYSMAITLGNGAALLFGGGVVAALSHSDTAVVPLLGVVRSWQAVLFLVGAPGLVVAAMMLFVREPVRRGANLHASSLGDSFAFIRRHALTLAMIVIAFALNGMITYCMNTWTPVTFMRTFGWTAGRIATAQGLILVIFGTVGIYTGGWWVSRASDSASNSSVFSVCSKALLIIPVFALTVAFAPLPWMRLVGVAGVAFLQGFPSGLAAVAIYHAVPNQFRGQVTAIYLMTGTLVGLGIGVTLVAAIADYIFRDEKAIGMSLGLVVTCVALLSATLLKLADRRADKDYIAQS